MARDKKKLTVPSEPIMDGEIKADLPNAIAPNWNDQGIKKGTGILDLRVTSWQLYILRKRHPFVAAVHNAIVKQVMKVELKVAQKDTTKELTPAESATKVRMEQFIETGFEGGEKKFRGRMVDTKKWNGDAFAEIVFKADADNEPLMVKYVMAETMRLYPDEHGTILLYPQVVDGKTAAIFPPENIIHLGEHPDEYSLFHYSDLESLFGALLLDTLADEHSISKLENDAMPAGILAGLEGDEIALARLRAFYITQLRQNPNKPVFMNGAPQWIPMGAIGIKDMDYAELHRQVKEKVMMVYSVLPMQVAVVETGRLANPEQQLEIGEEYIRQEIELVQEAYNHKLASKFKDAENLMFQFAELDPKIETLQKNAEIAKIKAETAKTLSTIPGAYMLNEIRAMTGHAEVDGGDEPVQQPVAAPNPFGAASASFSKKARAGKPFAGYADFDSCVEQNQDKDNPEAYCATLMQETESANSEGKALILHKEGMAQGQRKMRDEFEKAFSKFMKGAVKEAKQHYEPKKGSKAIGAFDMAIAALVKLLGESLDAQAKLHAIGIYSNSKEALGFQFDQQDEKAILALLNSNKGAFDAIKSFGIDQKAGLAATLDEAFRDGLSVRDMVKSMQEYADIETYKLERIARTESHRFATQGRIAGYKEMEARRGEEFEYNWTGPDDDRTSEECKDILDGNPYTLDELTRITYGGVVHPNERHVITRVVK